MIRPDIMVGKNGECGGSRMAQSQIDYERGKFNFKRVIGEEARETSDET